MMNPKIQAGLAVLAFAFVGAAQAADNDDKKPTDPEEYEFREQRVVRLSGKLDRGAAISVIQKMKYLDANNPRNEDITFIINSDGGNVEQGLAVYDTMRALKSDVKTVCEGVSYSMGAFLISAGAPGKRIALPSCRMMFHHLSAGTDGKFSDIKSGYADIRDVHQVTMDYLSRFLNRNKRDLEKAFAVDKYYSAKDAKELGAIDDIPEPLRALPRPGTRALKIDD